MNFNKDGLLKGISNADYRKLFSAWKADQLATIHVLTVIGVVAILLLVLGLALLVVAYLDDLGGLDFLAGLAASLLVAIGIVGLLFAGIGGPVTDYNLSHNPELHFIQSFTSDD